MLKNWDLKMYGRKILQLTVSLKRKSIHRLFLTLLLAGFFSNFFPANSEQSKAQEIEPAIEGQKKPEFNGNPLNEVAIFLCRENGANVIVSPKVGKVPVFFQRSEGSFFDQMERLAKLGNGAVVQTDNVLAFMTPEQFTQFHLFPPIEGVQDSSVVSLNFQNADFRDLANLIAERCDLGIICEKSVRGNISCLLSDVPWPIALHHLAATLGFQCAIRGKTIFIAEKKKIGFILSPLQEQNSNGKKVSFQCRDTDIRDVFGAVTQLFSKDFISALSVRGNVSIKFKDLEELEALNAIARTQGFVCEEKDKIWVLTDSMISTKVKELPDDPFPASASELLSICFRDVSLESILGLIAQKSNLEIGISQSVKGFLTLRMTNRAPHEILCFIAASNGYLFSFDGKKVTLKDPSDSPSTIEIIHH
ncbi:hypothetical protein HYY75_13425 [bacterium]|nr:hypothetical protein [bacterium]